MIAWLLDLFHRFRALRHVERLSDDGLLLLHRSVLIRCAPGSRIRLADHLTIGHPTALPFPSHPRTVVVLGRDATLEALGPVTLSPGTLVFVASGATLTFGGDNQVGPNTAIHCHREVSMGKGALVSWNATLMDFDENHAYRPDGTEHRRVPRPLRIGAGVGIQMNVTIPAGVTIGDRSIISANTVLRRDVPAHTLAYERPELVLREGYLTKRGPFPADEP